MDIHLGLQSTDLKQSAIRNVPAQETNPKSSSSWLELNYLKEFKFNFIKEINEHLVNFSVCSKCETIIMNISLPDHKLNLNTPV